jgi:hypothetical protein
MHARLEFLRGVNGGALVRITAPLALREKEEANAG